MGRFLAHRIALGLFVVAGVVVLTFALARVVPGDPAASWVGPHSSAAQLAQARHTLGLDRSLPVQIGDYFKGIFTGDWGISIHTHRPVLSDLGSRAPASLELVVAALVLAAAVGIPAGLLSVHFHGKLPDVLVRLFSVLGVSMPIFWLALILQLVFFQRLHLLPVAGEYDPNLDYTSPLHVHTHMPVVDALVDGNWPVFTSALKHLVLPMVAVASYPGGLIVRMVRASVLDVLGEDHVRMVRALGFSERSLLSRFALKPALNPVIAVVALVFAYSLVNTFLVETIFDWPGLGSYAADSIQSLDTPAIIGVTLFIALVYVGSNLVVDLVQAAVDPRIRLR
ncbi:MAG: ABC transporter permease [Gaiellaceae bacterium]